VMLVPPAVTVNVAVLPEHALILTGSVVMEAGVSTCTPAVAVASPAGTLSTCARTAPFPGPLGVNVVVAFPAADIVEDVGFTVPSIAVNVTVKPITAERSVEAMVCPDEFLVKVEVAVDTPAGHIIVGDVVVLSCNHGLVVRVPEPPEPTTAALLQAPA